MANILRNWGKKVHSQDLSTKEQIIPADAIGQELADEQLEAVTGGGCGQPTTNQGSCQLQSYGGHHTGHHHHYGNNSSSQNPWQSNSSQNPWQSNSGQC